MYNFIIIFNIGMLLLFLLLYSYQIFYAFIGVLKKANVYERTNKDLVGKGYALDYIFKIIMQE